MATLPSNAAAANALLAASSSVGKVPLVTYDWKPSTQLANYLAARANVAAGVANAQARIVAVGDSTTLGFGGADSNYRDTTSYPADLAVFLTEDGVAAQSDNFLGQGNENSGVPDQRIALIGGAIWGYPYVAGGPVVVTTAAGEGFNFTLAAPRTYDRVDVSYVDSGNGVLNVSANGGPVLATLQIGNTGKMMTQTVTLPLGSYSEVSVTAGNANTTDIEGASFWNSTTPAVQVMDAGVGGAQSTAVGDGVTPGAGMISSAAAMGANLALINFGINDILQGTETAAQTTANIGLMVQEFRANGADAIIIIPQPIAPAAYTAEIATLRADIYQLADTLNVGVIDLSATYGDSATALSAAGLLGADGVHPTATFYADVAAGLATLLTAPPATVAAAPVFSVVSSSAPCYCPGTLILTESGERPVETLQIGERVWTVGAGWQPIKWIGRRSYDGRFIAGQVLMLPVCIKRGAIADHVPARDLWVSPGHAIGIQGVLVPAWLLANGASIVQAEAVESVSYIHVELAEHALILAEGCPAETFIDDDCRGQFHNADEFQTLYPNEAAETRKLCAERIEHGFALQVIQRQLAARAGPAAGATRRTPGALRGFVDQVGPVMVSGWAQDENQPEVPVCLDIRVGGRRVARVLANHYRADLRQAGMGSGKHSFEIRLPEDVAGPVEVRRSSDQAVLPLTERADAKAA